ncbi:MAG: M1 family aminopeptidase [Acidobacteriota bacterium]
MRPALIVMIATVAIASVAGWAVTRGRRLTSRVTAVAIEPGTSRTLAADRSSRISNLRYALSLEIPAAVSQPISGRLDATFELRDASRPLVFDFAQPPERLLKMTAGGRTTSPRVESGHIVVPPLQLSEGRNVVSFEFLAGDESLNRHDDFMYSLFVPSRASVAIPVFDQPDLKARWQLSLKLPRGWQAVSNGREAGRVTAGEQAHVTFDETRPIPTYLFAIVAGRFSIDTAERDGRTLRMFHRESDGPKVARNRDAIFDLHARALAWMTTYTGIGYPFGKFDFVLLPSFQFGGMEHPGAIYYNADALLLEESATQNQQLNRANVISHETAHMWFGDLVTMPWFDDVWMKEVFANFFAAKIVNPSFPSVNHPLRFLLQNYPAAYEVDRTAGANPIRQPLDNLSEAGSLYGAIIYQKAPIVMRQLELLLGEDALRDGLREYLTTNAYGNASWTDLIRVLDDRTPRDLAAWGEAWVSRSGRPAIATELETNTTTITRLALRQSDPAGRDVLWPQRLAVMLGRGSATESLPVTIDGVVTAVAAATGRPRPDWVLPTGEGLGYGDFVLDPATESSLSTTAHRIQDPLTRGSALLTLWESMLDGRVPITAMREELLAALPQETNELLLQWMLDQTRALFWRWTPAAERPAYSARLEPLLREGLNQARSTSAKAAWFATIRSVATERQTVEWLEAVWRREVRVEGLPLAETDEADLALDLAVRDVPHAESILAAQLERFVNPDRRARFAFVVPAVSRDRAARERFFESLEDVRNRTREAWVLDAARYLHHPLRAQSSASLVRPALDLLWDLQRTGDIFFPKRWADATLAGYQGPAIADEVHAFINSLPPNYPPRLRWVLLASADPLFRSAAILKH